MLLLLLSLASAAPIPPSGLAWVPQSVRYPLAKDAVLPTAPFVDVATPQVRATVDVAPDKGAAFYLDGLDIVRVRVTGGSGTPRFYRVFGGSRAAPSTGIRAQIADAGIPDPSGGWLLAEEPGDGDVWYVEADGPATIAIERPEALAGRLIWEDVRAELRAAMHGHGPLPELPTVAGAGATSAAWAAEAALGDALIAAGGEDLEDGVRAWRIASGLRGLDALRPLTEPEWQVRDITRTLPGVRQGVVFDSGDPTKSLAWRRLAADQAPWTMESGDDGVIRLQVRPILPVGALVATEETVVTIKRGAEVLVRDAFFARPARVARDEEAAFPDRVSLVAEDGAWVGRVHEYRVPVGKSLGPISVEVRGGALIRSLSATRRVWWADVAGAGDPEKVAARALASLPEGGGAAGVLRMLLTESAGGDPASVPLPTGLPPELSLVAELVEARHRPLSDAELADRAWRWTTALKATPDTPWSWWLRIGLADVAEPVPGAAWRMFASARTLPEPGMLAEAARLIDNPAIGQDRPDRALGALEIAWRGLPFDSRVRTAYLRRWLDGSTWSRITPIVLLSGDAVSPTPLTWLDTAAGTGGPISAASTIYYRARAGSSRVSLAPTSPFDPRAPAVLSTLIRTPKDAGLVSLSVDNKSFHLLPIDTIERADVLVPPGRHTVTFDSPAGGDAWVALPPEDLSTVAPEDLATLRSYWPVAISGVPLRFEIPSPIVPVPVRVEVRALNPSTTAPIEVVVRTDTGASFPVRMVPGTPDPTLLAINGAAPISAVAAATLEVPANTQQLWVDAAPGIDVVASFSVRRTEAPDAEIRPSAARAAASLGEVVTLGRQIQERPSDPAPLIRRAQLLVDLGDFEMARQDLRRLLRMGDAAMGPSERTAIDLVYDRLDLATDARFLPALADLADVRGPVALSGDLVIADAGAMPPELVAAVGRLRAGDVAGARQRLDALDKGLPIVAWLRGRMEDDAGAGLDGAFDLMRAWRLSGDWQLGLEAAFALHASMTDPGVTLPAGAASTAYGLATDLRRHVEHPLLSRLATLAGRGSRWEIVRGAQAMSARVSLTTADAPTPPSPQADVRGALITAPWPASEAQIARGKEPAVVTVNGPIDVSTDVWCQGLRLGDSVTEPGCVLDLMVDGVAVGRSNLASRERATLKTGPLGPGRHEVAVEILDPGRVGAASVRLRADRSVAGSKALPDGGWLLTPRRDTAAFVGQTGQPVEIAALGPASLYLDLRGPAGQGGAVEIRATGPSGALPPQRVLLSVEGEPEVSVDGGPARSLSQPTGAVVVLPTAGTWRVRIEPTHGALVTRAALRVDTAMPTVERPGPIWHDLKPETEPVDWPALPPALVGVHAAARPPKYGRIGTFSVWGAFGQQDLDAAGTDAVDQHSQAEVGGAWRMQAVPSWLWLRVQGLARAAPSTPTVGGATVDALLRIQPIRTRLLASGEFFAQDIAGKTAWTTNLTLRAYGQVSMGKGFSFLPSLQYKERILSLDAAPVTTGWVDPDVFNTYALSHRHALTPSLMIWGMPLQDQTGYVSVSATTNADMRSLDQLQFALVSRTAIHPPKAPPMQLELRYRPSYRFADADRPTAYVRHAVGGSFGAWFRTSDPTMIWLGVDDMVYLSPGVAPQNVLFAALRFDWNGGRGLTDRLPIEQDLGQILSGRRWGPWEDETQ